MKKKIFAVAAVAAVFTLAGSSAAFADDDYPIDIVCSAAPAAVAPGESTEITCSSETGFIPGEVTGYFETSGPGVVDGTTLTSIVLASANGSASVEKTSSVDGVFTATFTAPAVTESAEYVVTLSPEEGGEVVGSTTIAVSVDAAGGGAGGGEGGEGALPATGGAAPMAAIWLGVGAVGIGGIAVAAAAARRRSVTNR